MGGHGRRGAPGSSRGGTPRVLEARPLGGDSYLVVVELPDGRSVELTARLRGDVLETPMGSFHVPSLLRGPHSRRASPSSGRGRGGGGSWLVEVRGGRLVARLPVRVVEASPPGTRVREGDVVAVVETMKMLNEVKAPCNGTVAWAAEPGSGVDAGRVIVEIRCEAAAGG